MPVPYSTSKARPSRRRNGTAASSGSLAMRPPRPRGATRQHANERVVAKHEMMNQRGGGVEARHDDQRIGGNLVNLRDRMREHAVARPGGRNVSDSEQWQCVAARELRDDTDDRDRKQQRIEREMPQ